MSRRPRRATVWPIRLAAAEGRANARSGRWTSVIVVLAVGWTIAGVGLASALEVSHLVRSEREWIDAGAHTFVVDPSNSEGSGGVDVHRCEQLALVDGVIGSFAASSTQTAAAAVYAPGTRATVALVSPGIYSFFGLRTPAGAQVIATDATVRPLGLADGDIVTLNVTVFDGSARATSSAATVAVVDSPILGDELSGSWLMPDLHTGTAARCYVRADAAHVDAVGAYVAEALTSPDGAPAVARPRLSQSSYGLDFSTVYFARPLAWGWAAAGAVLAALWAVVAWGRRSRWAIYATFGAHRAALLMVQVSEWAALSSLGAVWGWATSLALALAAGADPQVAVVQVTGHGIAAWAAATLGVVGLGLLPVGTLLDALKDRS